MEILKKYVQVTAFLVFFGLLIIVKNYMGHSDDEGPVSIGKPNLQTPTTSSTPLETANASPISSAQPNSTPTTTPNTGKYNDGTYTGTVEDAYYGNIQVQAVIRDGRLSDVIFLQYPNDNRTSLRINTQATPYLKEEAIAAQSANVNLISGASDSSFAFRKSLSSALQLAQK